MLDKDDGQSSEIQTSGKRRVRRTKFANVKIYWLQGKWCCRERTEPPSDSVSYLKCIFHDVVFKKSNENPNDPKASDTFAW